MPKQHADHHVKMQLFICITLVPGRLSQKIPVAMPKALFEELTHLSAKCYF